MKPPVRILQIVDKPSLGSGVFQVVLNWNKHIDKSKIQFDYLTFLPIISSEDCTREIQALGGKVYYIPFSLKHPMNFLKGSYRFFKTHRYHTVHSHITHLNFFFYPLAKWFGTKNIIQHAHGTKWSDKKLNGWRNYLMLHAVWPLITYKLACSQAAGKFWYGKNFTVVNNGIDVEKFAYNPAIRVQKRKELGLESNFVVAHVGRFSSEKNHTFLIDILAATTQKEPSAKLVLIGEGPLKTQIQTLVRAKHLEDKVIFLGTRKDVPDLLQAFDVFVLPSLHEGMPIVGVEAQAAGLLCVFSDTITPEICLLPSSCMLPLSAGALFWADKILSLKNKPRQSGKERLQAHGFDIRQTAKQMQELYELLEECKSCS